MIAEVIATYHGTQDMVQATAILQENDGTSLHQMLKSASISLLQNNEPILVKELAEQDYNEGEKGYYVFFIHPPIQKHLYIVFEATLKDDRTARTKNIVSISDQLPYNDIATNPMLAGKPVKDHTNTWDSEGQERKPD
jgi:hypothetical protein